MQTPNWVCTQADTLVLMSVIRTPVRPQQQDCDGEKLCQNSPFISQVAATLHKVRVKVP